MSARSVSDAKPTASPYRVLALLSVLALVPQALLFSLHPSPLEPFAELWPVLPLAFFAAACASATAIGGGFLFVPLFIFGYGIGPLMALQLALGTQSVGMSSGALGWSRQFIDMRALVLGSGFAFVGLALGTLVWTPSPLEVKAVFGWVSLFVATVIVIELRAAERGNARDEDMPMPKPLELVVFGLACIAGGLITAWVSIGVGEVIALWLLFRHRTRIEKAIGTGVGVLALCSILGLVIHASTAGSDFPWTYLAFTAPGVILGGFCGARAARWIEPKMAAAGRPSPIKIVFALVAFLDGLVMLFHVHRHG